ncbi:protoglobin domain-containing protein [Paenibacillus glucanolyticus]
MEQKLEAITDAFYQSVVDVDKLRNIIVQHSTIERLKQTLRDHLFQILNGEITMKPTWGKDSVLPKSTNG